MEVIDLLLSVTELLYKTTIECEGIVVIIILLLLSLVVVLVVLVVEVEVVG